MAKTKSIKSKKNTYDGIEFKSALELYCYKRLKDNGFDFQYEPESITLVDGFRNEGVYFKCTNGSKTMVNRTGSKEFPITNKPDFVWLVGDGELFAPCPVNHHLQARLRLPRTQVLH